MSNLTPDPGAQLRHTPAQVPTAALAEPSVGSPDPAGSGAHPKEAGDQSPTGSLPGTPPGATRTPVGSRPTGAQRWGRFQMWLGSRLSQWGSRLWFRGRRTANLPEPPISDVPMLRRAAREANTRAGRPLLRAIDLPSLPPGEWPAHLPATISLAELSARDLGEVASPPESTPRVS